jgi:Zn-dependent M28 family amino/carboxypeptidase
MRKFLFGLLLVVLAIGAPKGKKVAKFGNSDAITEREMKIHEYFLASDQMEGRNLPSRGFDTAALYVASNLAQWGVTPMGSATGTNGPLQPYFMPFELVSKQVVGAESKATVTGSAKDFAYAKDWVVSAGRGAVPLDAFDAAGNVVFAGNGYVVNKTNVNPFEGLDVKGKIVVVAGLPAEIKAQQARGAGANGGGAAANPLGEACTDFLTPEQAAARNGALAVVKVESFQQAAAGTGLDRAAAPMVGGEAGPNGPAYRVAKFPSNLACPAVPAVTAGLAMVSSIFQGEKQSGEKIFGEEGTPFALSADKKISLHVAVKSFPNHAENVIGLVEGSDPVLKNEYVVVSAHLDHIGLTNATTPGADNINNGADDDGSGSTALLAIARVYAEGAAKGMRPKRSMIFLWNAGEEKGLWGSQYFAEFPPVDITKVVADLNIDMIGRTKGPGFEDTNKTHVLVNPKEILLVGPNISSDDLEKTLESTNNEYQKLVLNHFYDTTAPDKTHDNLGPQPRGQRIFYRSDHYNFAKVGVPIVFFTTGLHPDYHRPSDSPDKLDYQEMVVVSKTVSALGWVLANEAGRPKINAVLPEQLMKDMKSAKDQGWGTLTPVLSPIDGEPF